MSSGRSALYAECIAQYVASGGLDPNTTSHTAEVIRQSASRTSQLGLRVAQTVFSSSLNADEHGAVSSINAHLQMLADDFLQSCSKYGVLSIPPIYVGWSPDTSAEGRVRQVDEGYLITINAGLTLLHSYVGRLLMMRGSTTVEVGGRVYSNFVPKDREDWQIGRDIGDALLGFVVGDLSMIKPISAL